MLLLAASLPARSEPPAEKKQPPRLDRYGDPLPEGAIARLGTVRFRHAGWIEHLAFSPDGTLLAGAGSDGIRLWESISGRPVRVLGGRADAVTFLDGGKRVAAGGDAVVAWEVADGREVARL
ncbi:MAG TPA: hypothetical protein VKI65_02255, partial [Gemmataceae bacterium]|nr:hypothetical protein [Gemmataceae bacterium]